MEVKPPISGIKSKDTASLPVSPFNGMLHKISAGSWYKWVSFNFIGISEAQGLRNGRQLSF